MLVRRSLPLILAFSLFLTFSCQRKAEEMQAISGYDVIEEEGTEVVAQREVINFGVTQFFEPERLKDIFSPLLEYLEQETGKTFVLNIAPSYDALKRDLLAGNLQMVSFSPATYANALTTIPDQMQYIATSSRAGDMGSRDYYTGVIVTRRDTGISSLDGLRGRSFGFVDTGSSSGYKYPVVLLLKNSINPDKDFSGTFFLGSHDKVIEAVAAGSVDAGATAEFNIIKASEEYGDVFEILARTAPIPNNAWVFSQEVPEEFVHEVQSLLVNLPADAQLPSGEPVFSYKAELDGLIQRDPSYYDVIIETAAMLDHYNKSRE